MKFELVIYEALNKFIKRHVVYQNLSFNEAQEVILSPKFALFWVEPMSKSIDERLSK